MKLLPKLLCVSAMVALAVALTACGGNSSASSASASASTSGASSAASASASQSASDEAAAAVYQKALAGEDIVNTFITENLPNGKIADDAAAEKCVMGMIDRLGGDKTTELEINSVRPVEDGMTTYTFTQRAGGVLVYGSTVKLIVDKDGNPIAVVSSIMPDVQIKPIESWAVDAAQAEKVVMDQLKAQDSTAKLVEGASERTIIGIPGNQDNYVCAWVVYTFDGGDADSHQVYDAHYVTAEGDYLYSIPMSAPGDPEALSGQNAKASFDFDAYEPAEVKATVNHVDGTTEEVTLPALKDVATGKTYLGDAKRKILCADYAAYANGKELKPIEAQDGVDPVDANEYRTFSRVWDYFDSVGWTGPDGDGTPTLMLMNYVDANGNPIDNAAYDAKKDGFQVFYFSRGTDFGECLDIVGHEFAHCITGATMTTNLYKNDQGAINEALSDIMGNVVEMRLNGDAGAWIVAEGRGEKGAWRNMADPHEYAQPEFAFDTYYAPRPARPTAMNDQGGVHKNSSLLNIVSYKLDKAGMTPQEQGLFWMNVALVLSPQADYPMLAEMLPWVMEQVGFDKYVEPLKAAIEEAKFTATEDPGTIPEGCGALTFDFAPIAEEAEGGCVTLALFKAPDAEISKRVETWPVAGTTVAKASVPAGDYYVVAVVGDPNGFIKQFLALGEDGWKVLDGKDPETIKANSKAVTVEAGKTVEVPNDGFGPVANEQFDMIRKALSREDEGEEGAEGQTE